MAYISTLWQFTIKLPEIKATQNLYARSPDVGHQKKKSWGSMSGQEIVFFSIVNISDKLNKNISIISATCHPHKECLISGNYDAGSQSVLREPATLSLKLGSVGLSTVME